MDGILYNAHIATMEKSHPHATALAMENGRIAAVGGRELLALKTADTKMIDARGRFVYPGFGDSHMHLLNYGETLTQADLSNLGSMEEMVQRVRAYINRRRVPAGAMVYASGWNQDLFSEKRLPTRHDLDKISTAHPIVLCRVCGHCTVVNTNALAFFGITADTPQPDGGRFEIEDGQPNGVFHETAQTLVRHSRAVSVAQAKDMLRAALQKAVAAGLTVIHSDDFASIPGFGAEQVQQAYRELEQEGALPVRIFQQCRFETPQAFEAFAQSGARYGQGSALYRLGPLKIIGDGSLGARTAWLNEPYSDDGSTCGVAAIAPEALEQMIRCAHRRDWPVAVHAIGDRTMDTVFRCLEKAQAEAPKALPHGIVHCQITSPGQLARFAEEQVAAYIQPIFLEYDLHIARDRVGARAQTSYAWNTLVDSGALVTSGSDCPVEPLDVLKNLYCAVARQDLAGDPPGGWHAGERLSMEKALRLCTQNIARLEGQQRVRGTLAPGKLADLVMVDRDLFACPPEELLRAKVCLTIMGGRVTFRAD